MVSPKRPVFEYAAVCAAALVLSGVVVGCVAPRLFPTRPTFTPAPLPAALLSTNALYTPADHKRLMTIGTALQKSQPVTDADLEWAIGLLQHGPVRDSTFARTSFAIRTLSQLINHKSMSPAQAHRLAQAVLPFAEDPPAAERTAVDGVAAPAISVQSTAVIVLRSLDDKAAITKLKQLARSSPTLKIRQQAGNPAAR